MSAASLLLCAGAPGMRYALPHSRIMVHQPSGGAQGQASDIAIQAAEILYLRNQLVGFLLSAGVFFNQLVGFLSAD